MEDVGHPTLVTLSVDTPDAGALTGLGIVFEAPSFADEFHKQMLNYFDTPRGEFRGFDIHIHDGKTYCDVAIDVATPASTMSIIVDRADHRVLEDMVQALEARPYFFLISCLVGADGTVRPYKADENFVAKGNFYLDGRQITGNPVGGWTKNLKLFG